MKQFTVREPIQIEGIGVHSGKPCKIRIKPAPVDFGIVYTTNENDPKTSVVANYANVCDTNMCTRIKNAHGTVVSVVEHISATFYATGITNAVVVVEDGGEIPFIDGSARAFVEAIEKSGLKEQEKERKMLKIVKEIRVFNGTRCAGLLPSDHFIVKAICDFSEKGLKTKPFTYDSEKDSFATEIAPARTFGFYSDVEYLRKNGLAIGASLENTVVFNENGFPIEGCRLRYENEPVRHKILDAIGDLSLCQCEIVGRYVAFCPGHGINNLLLRELFKDESNYELK